MNTATLALETFTNLEGNLKLLARATQVDDVVKAAAAYLAGWSQARVRNLQKIDGGWGPFDFDGRPNRISGLADVIRIADAMNHHCLALKNAGIDGNDELQELHRFFSSAKPVAESFILARRRPDATGATGATGAKARGYQHWSDQGAVAA